ncbi:MAG: hypothetical protein Q4G14_08150 [Paracoccus sp. (in: a-proteobacteria)]|uniref:hypothetical protein n=1 Tax=Paracoccus sp. TaxID=267 RepID=UPI0026E0D647|nr:hypothetical protein [Paracoccus sp. (in: a-proteobacteria)]MDO5613197.1 hypothetical protein [Paracoccus sp. (in: a-proteobacteria)]
MVRWIGAGILAAAVMTMVLADIVLAAPAPEQSVAVAGHADHTAGVTRPLTAK